MREPGQGIAADLDNLEQRANLFFELIAVRQADESLRYLAIPRDHDRRGQAN